MPISKFDEDAQRRRDVVVTAQAQLDIAMKLFAAVRMQVGGYLMPGMRAKVMEISEGLSDYQDEIRRILLEEKF